MLAVISTGQGCKIRCLTCGYTGPERESEDRAWAALMGWREEAGVGK